MSEADQRQSSDQVALERELRGYINRATIVVMVKEGGVDQSRNRAVCDRWRDQWGRRVVLVAPSYHTNIRQVADGQAWVQWAERLNDLCVGYYGIEPAFQIVAVSCRDFSEVWLEATAWVLERLLPRLLPGTSSEDRARYLKLLDEPARALVIRNGVVDETAR